ncbi:MAG: 4-hydroxy-tetrahydrodipicolinate synthase [Armatimonadota bacterium]
MKLEGAYTAIVNPLTPDGCVDYDGLIKNIEFQVSQGIAGVVPVGTTGESPTISQDERKETIERTIAAAAGRCKVIAGTGSNSTEKCIANTKHAAQAGVDAALVVDCYYNGPSSQELRDEYYSVVAEEFPGLTIVPYIIPGRTGTALSVEDLAILYAKYPNISAVKEATGDLARMVYTRELCGRDFNIISGDDDLTYKMMTDPKIAADGVISVASNVIPGPAQEMVSAVKAGNLQKAEKLQNALDPLLKIVTVKAENERTLPDGRTVKVVDKYRNPVAIKTLMSALGMPSGACRRPLGKMTKPGVEVVRKAIKTVWDNNPELLAPIAEFYGIDIEARIADDNNWM